MRQTTGIILLEFLTGAVLFVGMVAALIAWRLMSGPTDIGFLKADVEKAMSSARDGRAVTIGELTLQWLQDDTEFKIIADDLKFLGENGEEVGGAKQAQLDLNAVALLGGKIELSKMTLETGSLSIQRNHAGEIRVADHVIPPMDPSLLPPDPTPLQVANFSLGNILKNVTTSQAVQQLDMISLRDFSVSFVDEPLAIDWKFDAAALDVVRDGQSLTVSATGLPVGAGAPETAEFKSDIALDTGKMSVVISLLKLSLPDFPALEKLPQKIEGRLSSDLLLQLAYDGKSIEQLSASFATSGGELKVDDRTFTLGENDISFLYDVPGNAFEVDGRAVALSVFDGVILLKLPDAENWFRNPVTSAHKVEITSPAFNLDLRPMFERSWQLKNAFVEGELDLATSRLTYSSAKVSVDKASAISSGELYLANTGNPKDLPFGIKLTAKTQGNVTPAQVLRFWPIKLGHSARKWVVENVRLGDLHDASFQMDFKPDSLRDEQLENEDLQLDFSFSNAEVTFLSDLPAIKKGVGRARLEGNRFSLDVSEGEFSKWKLDSGSVQIPQFKPDGELLTVKAHGTGNVRDIVKTISSSRLQLEKEYGLNVEDISGVGEASFFLTRPLKNDVADEETLFRAEGKVREGGFKGVFTDLDLTRANAVVKVDNDHIRINGYGELLNTPVQFDWEDRFDIEGDTRTKITASGNVTPDVLNRYGLATRAYLTGDVFAKLTARGSSVSDLSDITADFDLTPNRLDFAELDWVKPAGEAANATLHVVAKGEGKQTSTLSMAADGFEFKGDLKSSETGKIDGVVLSRLFLQDQLDISGELSRLETGGLLINVKGPFINLAPYLDGVMASGSSGGATPVFGDVTLTSEFEKLRLRDGFDLSDVNLDLNFKGPVLQTLSLNGESNDVGDIRFDLTAGEGNTRVLDVKVSDAGGLLLGVAGMDFVKGGTLTATGVLKENPQDPTDLVVTIKDARLKNAPLLTQILSLASLRGLTDVMSGEGILFTDVRLPLTIDQRGYYVKGAKASGPAMGFTTSGHILDDGKQIALDGVLVPSFGVNSALGGIPIIGDLFVSRDGEGVFAITYGVRGSLSEAKVSVNPLSGLLPGVLRRIFENPVEEPIPDTQPAPKESVPSE